MMTIEYKVENSIALSKLLPELSNIATAHFAKIAREDIEHQLPSIRVVTQIVRGNAENFEFMAFPFPRLTAEQLQNRELRDEESFAVEYREISVQVSLDCFGQVNWFHVSNAPKWFEVLVGEMANLVSHEKIIGK